MSMIMIDVNGTSTPFNINEKTKVDVLLPSVAVYIKHDNNNEIVYLATEYIEIPKAHYQSFNPHFIAEIEETLIHQIYHSNYTERDIYPLKHIVEALKRQYPMSYELE